MHKDTKMRSSTERPTTYPFSRYVMRVAFTGIVNAIVSIKLCKTKLLDEALSHHFQVLKQGASRIWVSARTLRSLATLMGRL